jgi:uncharacterized phage-associated protein
MLDLADSNGILLTNLALQKLLYFCHSIFLINRGIPLIKGYFEAWQYGPVHPTVYSAFKPAGDKPITFRATKQDILSGARSEILPPSDPEVRRHVTRIVAMYGGLTAARLVEISHAKNAPWHYVVEKSQKTLALGLRIPDNVIRERFRHHKVAVSESPSSGEPREDTPPA